MANKLLAIIWVDHLKVPDKILQQLVGGPKFLQLAV